MDTQKLSPGSPDGMLAASARDGDLDAFRELYHRYVRHVYDYMLRTLHDPAVARDLTQATFLRAHGRMPMLRDPDRVREWLFGHAYKLATGQLRRGPVPLATVALPRAAGPRRAGEGAPAGGGGVATGLGDVEGADLVWEAASMLPPELYAVLDVTARQGVDAGELAEDAGVPRAEVMAQLERAHEAFGRSVRELLVRRSGDWCPGLDSLLQTSGAQSVEERARVDEHLGSCPRCRPIAERLTTPATLSETPLHTLDRVLAGEGWDLLVADMAKAAPRATRAALHEPQAATEDTAHLVASPAAMEYFAFPVPGAPRRETDMMRHESVRRAHAQAERARFRAAAGWAALVAVLLVATIAAILVHYHHGGAPTVTRPSSTLPGAIGSPSTTVAPSTTARRPTTTVHATTTTKRTTTTQKAPTTTIHLVLVPVPIVGAMSPQSGFPGAPVTLTGSNFTAGDLVDFTGPTLPGGTEELTPSAMSPNSISSNVPAFATFAGQRIAVAVQNSQGVRSRSVTFVVEPYWSGTWTNTGGKVSLQPSSATHGTTHDGQIEVFQTDVENEQCMVNRTAAVYLPVSGTGPPLAVIPKTRTCPSAEFVISR